MRITNNGRYVTFENEDDLDRASDEPCVCGHDLGAHKFEYLPMTKKTIEIKSCTLCNCGQFKLTGKVERVKDYLYA